MNGSRGRGNGRGRFSGSLCILGWHVYSEFRRLDRKPKVTAGLIAANTLVYLRPGVLDDLLPPLLDVCLNPDLVVENRDLKRLFLSAFYHEDESHLVYNMFSLLWKGVQLERMKGSTEFASMVAVLLGLSHGIVVVLAKALETFFDYPFPWTSECGVGFSPVLFALKVVLNSNSSNLADVYGVLVPAQYAAWAELLLIQMIVPRVSFLGHLSGIFAGLLYLWLRRFFSGSNPLSPIIRKLTWIMGWPERFFRRHRRHRRRTLGRGTESGRVTGGAGNVNAVWHCPNCFSDNNIYLERCEVCHTRQASASPLYPTAPAGFSENMPLDELRRLRLEHFNR